MKDPANTRRILKATLVFCLLNLSLYFFAANFHHLLPFQLERYTFDAYHFLPDPVAENGAFNFLRSWGQYDAQWFLNISQNSYPFRPPAPILESQFTGSGLAYAFFPLYPLLVSSVNFLFRHLELSAFFVSNLLLLANFFSLIYLVSRTHTVSVGIKSAFLLFAFPFSIFFRSYFSEGLFLFLLIWLTHFLLQKKYVPAALFLGLANVTRGTGLLFNVFFIFSLVTALRRKSISISQFLLSGLITALPLLIWITFNFYQTGDPFYFYNTLSAWFVSPFLFAPLLYNIFFIFDFPNLPLHFYHQSQIDIIVVITSFILLLLSRKNLPRSMWLIALFLWLTPLLSHDLMSFSRYSSVIFPLFVYLTSILGQKAYFATLFIFTISLFFTSLLFVNWYWIG